MLRSIRAALRNPVFLLMGLSTPIIYLALFSPLLNTIASYGAFQSENVLTLFVSGMLPIIAFGTGIFTGFGMIDEVRSGVLERFRVTPASRFSILLGPVLFDTCTALFQSLLFILIALPFGFRANPCGILMLFGLITLLTLTVSAFGNTVGIIVKEEDRYAPIIHGIHLPVLLLSGSLLPISLAPNWLKVLAHFNPVFYAVEASRTLAFGNFSSSSVFYAFLILIAFAIGTLTWATRVFKKAVT